ncbi:MAG: glycosyltransferase family 2 protein [Bacteroidota bacterium]|nr:glycosyltransferase family 2 protein [Candidatus Kapabacteria bacterium]MDW8219732.1 glycosyltransferase family 2 protein [Bacteroidota bacterium]
MKSETYSLSVIVPVYNEVDLLGNAISAIDAVVKQNFENYEIIIVESGSTDGTGELCDALANAFTRVRVIHEGARNGFGSALKRGYSAATMDWVWFVTADTPFPLDAIVEAKKLFPYYDCILSYRSQDTRKSLFRKIQSVVYNAIVKLLLRLRVKHVNSAFKVFKREVIQSLPLLSNGWFIDAETLYWLTQRRVRYIEIPVPLIDRAGGHSTITLSTPLSLLKELQNFLRQRRTMR